MSFTHFDSALFQLINLKWHTRFLDYWMPLITDYHRVLLSAISLSPWPLILIGTLFVVWISISRWQAIRAILMGLVALGISDVTCTAIKPLVNRPRPQLTLKTVELRSQFGSRYSFPSNHASNNFAVAKVVGSVFVGLRPFFYLFAGAIAYSRVYCGVHYPSDVIAGALIGLGVGALVQWVFSWIPIGFAHSWSQLETARRQKRIRRLIARGKPHK